jgi:hypothetical protein
MGVIKELKRLGVKPGDKVYCEDFELDYEYSLEN